MTDTKQSVQAGDRVRLVRCTSPSWERKVPEGTRGEVQLVAAFGEFVVAWDNGVESRVLPGAGDEVEVLADPGRAAFEAMVDRRRTGKTCTMRDEDHLAGSMVCRACLVDQNLVDPDATPVTLKLSVNVTTRVATSTVLNTVNDALRKLTVADDEGFTNRLR